MGDYNPQPFVSNPMSSFDPTQWANPYSLFKGQALPWPSQYAGPPTDAFGQPIQSYVDANNAAQANYQQQLAAYNAQPAQAPQQTPGTTLNSSAASPPTASLAQQTMYPASVGNQAGNLFNSKGQMQTGPAFAYAASTGQPLAGGPNRAQIDAANAGNAYMAAGAAAGAQGNGWGSRQGAGNAAESAGWGYQMQNAFNQAQAPPQAAPARAGPPTPPDMSQAYLHALANPGPLRPVGANVPANAATTQPGPGVLQQFLANWQPQGGSGPGAGFTQAFSKALRGA